jgi:hypothetical protein
MKTYSRIGRAKGVVEETLVSQSICDEAVRCMISQVRLDRSHDVPYLAGSSRDGKTIYIDRHLPRTIRQRGRVIAVAPFLIVHEVIEKLLFNRFRITYPHAHQFALRLEQVTVRNAGISWHDYNAVMQRYVKRAHDERITSLPSDLEIKPYTDEGEAALLKQKQRLHRRQHGHRPHRTRTAG